MGLQIVHSGEDRDDTIRKEVNEPCKAHAPVSMGTGAEAVDTWSVRETSQVLEWEREV